MKGLVDGAWSIRRSSAGDHGGLACLQLQPGIPLRRLVDGGLDENWYTFHQEIQGCLFGDGEHPEVYLVDPGKDDIQNALGLLRAKPRLMRRALGRHVSSDPQSAETIRKMDPEQLFAAFHRLLASAPDSLADREHRWHAILTGNKWLPFYDRQQAEKLLADWQKQGQIVHYKEQGADYYLPPGGKGGRHLLLDDSCLLILSKDPCQIVEVGHIGSSPSLTHAFTDLEHQWEWISERVSRHRKAAVLDGSKKSIKLPKLAGLGECHLWEAFIGGAEIPQDLPHLQELEALHPADDWLPESWAAFTAPVDAAKGSLPQSPVGLALSVQARNIGHLVHKGLPAQAARLGRQVRPLRLFQPLNPFVQAPPPLGGASQSIAGD